MTVSEEHAAVAQVDEDIMNIVETAGAKSSVPEFNTDQERHAYREMLLIRRFEEKAGQLYGMGFIGAAIYYISVASGFWAVVLAVLKAIVWPVLLVYQALKFLG